MKTSIAILSILISFPILIFAQTSISYSKTFNSKIELNNFIPEIIRTAASPDDPTKILLSLYGWNASKRRSEVNVFVSIDVGKTYNHVLQDATTQWVSELSCAFGSKGNAYVITGASKRTGKLRGHTYGQMHLFHSSDGGLTWNKPTTGPFIDWTAATADASQGKNRNKLYIFGHDIADSSGSWVGPRKPLIVSSDFGKSISKPLFTGTWPDDGGGYPLSAKINDKGIVFALYKRVNPSGLLIALTKDGGKTLELLPTIQIDTLIRSPNIFDIGFDIDKSNEKFKNRLYIAYTAFYMGQPSVMLASSDDMGYTWNHKIASHYSTKDNEQNLGSAALSVNKNGIVGVTWNEPQAKVQKFAISQNGGASFELPITLSNGSNLKVESSQFFENQLQTMGTFEPDAANNEPAGAHSDGLGLSIRILPAASRTIELSSDANSNFHPFWTEQQSMGILSLFTTTIQINKKRGMFQKDKPDLKTFQNVNAKVIVDFWKQQYDANTGEFILDFTLTNKSDSILVGPVFIELSKIIAGFGFGDPMLINDDAIDYSGNPILDVSKILIGGKLKPDMQTLKYTIAFKVKQNIPTEQIWQKVQEGETIHPISCQFNIYARIE